MRPVVECRCLSCVSACYQLPGILAPTDLEPMARRLRIDVETLIRRYLVPASSGPVPLALRPRRGPAGCVFLRRERCRVHKAKPTECAEMDCRQVGRDSDFDALSESWSAYWQERFLA